MTLRFYKSNTIPENMSSGDIFFDSSVKKIYIKDGDNLICYTNTAVPEIILPNYIGIGTTYGATQTIELNKNIFYIIGRCQNLTLTLPPGADTDCIEYSCQFYVPNSSFTLTIPSGCLYQNGIAPTFEANTCYQLVIVNNCISYAKFS